VRECGFGDRLAGAGSGQGLNESAGYRKSFWSEISGFWILDSGFWNLWILGLLEWSLWSEISGLGFVENFWIVVGQPCLKAALARGLPRSDFRV